MPDTRILLILALLVEISIPDRQEIVAARRSGTPGNEYVVVGIYGEGEYWRGVRRWDRILNRRSEAGRIEDQPSCALVRGWRIDLKVAVV
jgi:hypothetical protein